MATAILSAVAAVTVSATPPATASATATAALSATSVAVTGTATPPTSTVTVTDTTTPPTSTVETLNAAADVTTTTDAYAHLPLSFEPNMGQTDPAVQFLAHGPGFTLYLTGDAATLTLVQPPAPALHHTVGRDHDAAAAVPLTATAPLTVAAVRLTFAGANPTPQIVGQDALPGVANYLSGDDPTHWVTDVPTYARVAYQDVYPGVDLVYYGAQGQLEYDWQVAPGADPHAIALQVDGARAPRLDAQGNLLLPTAVGVLVQHAPVVYQQVDGQRQLIPARYVLTGPDQVGFDLGAYDPSQPLIIDPVLSYSTYLGGSGGETAYGIAVDSAGNSYVTGQTASTNFPTAAPLYGSNAGGSNDVFVSKLNASGSALVYSTYLGGSGDDRGFYIAVDAAGNAIVTGYTTSTNFPTAAAVQSSYGGGPYDVFVTKLNASGNALVYSTYLGGSGDDEGYGVAVDSAGNAYVTGQTNSTNFPTASPLQGSSGGNFDAFVSKLSSAGALVYSTYLGGWGGDFGNGIAVDSAGNAYVSGYTSSTNYPTVNALQASYGGGSYDAFVSKLNAAGSALVYSTFLGGSDLDKGAAIAVDSAGSAYVTGRTASTNFPTLHPLDGSFSGGSDDAFVAKLNASGNALVFSTYLGGGGDTRGYGIAVNWAGTVYLTGYTTSANFPTASAVQGSYGGGPADAFVSALNAAGSALLYSTFLGGSGDETGWALALDAAGNVDVTGDTSSANFPTVTPLQGSYGGNYDGFVARLLAASSGTVPWHAHHALTLGGGLDLSVDLSDGHLDLGAADMTLPGRGPSLVVRHIWDSALAQGGLTTTAGAGWLTNLTTSIGGVLTGTVVYTDGSGATWPFSYTGALSSPGPYTSYATPPGVPWQLSTSTAGYTLTNILSGETLTFNAQGQFLADTDSYGNNNTLMIMAGGIADLVNSGGRDICLPYYPNGLLSDAESTLWEDSGGTQGQHVTYGYGGAGGTQLTRLTWGAGTTDALTATFGYSGTAFVTVTTPASHTWSLGYDPFGRLSRVTSPISGTAGQTGYTPAYTTQITYNPGQTVVVQGAGSSAALTTTYTLDGQGEATRVTDGLGHSSSLSYDVDHDVLTSTDANGRLTTNAYQYVGASASIGLITQTVQPPVALYNPANQSYTPLVTTHKYDPTTDDLIETDLPAGGVIKYSYDGHHGVVATTQQTSQTTCTPGPCPTTWRGTINSYDQYGELVSTTDGRGVSVAQNGTATLNDPAGLYTSYTGYDAAGNAVSNSTPVITTTLNGLTTTAPVTTEMTYDLDGNMTAQLSANGNATTYSYDHLGRQIATGQPPVPLWTGTSPATTVTTATVDDSVAGSSLAQFHYVGAWASCTDCGSTLYEGSNSWDNTTNDYVTVAFTGTALALYGVKDPQHGIGAVSLDGGAETLVDFYAPSRAGNQLLWSSGTLAAGRHTFKLRVTGTKNSSSSGYYVVPDRVDIGLPSMAGTTTRYDGDGNAVRTTDGTGDVTTSSYDPQGRQVSETNPVSGTSVLTYSATNLVAQQDPQGNVTTDSYDGAGRLLSTNAPVSGTTQYQYDAVGNTVAITQLDRTTGTPIQIETRGYDALNRVITDTVSGPGGPSLTTLTAYDPDGNVAQVEQPKGDVTYNTYDLADQLTNVEIDSAPLSGPGAATHPKYEAYSYDAAGNVVQSVDADNRTTTTSYDGDNRVTQSVAASVAPTGTTTITTTLGYDPDGNTLSQSTRTTDTTSPGQVQTHTYTATYNADDGLTSSNDDGLVTTYGYDAADQQRTQTIINGSTPATTTLDAEGRATSISESYGGSGPYSSLFGYNQDDQPLTATLPGGMGVAAQAQYDPDSRLTALTWTGPNTGSSATTLSSQYAYGYNAASWTTALTTIINGASTAMQYTHDAQGRLTSWSGQLNGPESWGYDANGNIITNSEYLDNQYRTTVYTYSATLPNEEVQQHTDGFGVEYFGYDGHGDTTNITSTDPITSVYHVNIHLSYDAQERPLTVTTLLNGAPITVSLGYNADGERSSYTVITGTNQTLYSDHLQYRNGQVAQDSVVSATAGGGSVSYTDTFLYDQNGNPLELLRQQSGTTSRYWYILDGLENVVALVDTTGKVVDRYAYDPWGEGLPEGTSETLRQPLRYGGYWWDKELGWYWIGVRSYDPEGRWLQPDPSDIDGLRTYAYVADDPIDATDPTGLCTILLHFEPGFPSSGAASLNSSTGTDGGFPIGKHPFLTFTDNGTAYWLYEGTNHNGYIQSGPSTKPPDPRPERIPIVGTVHGKPVYKEEYGRQLPLFQPYIPIVKDKTPCRCYMNKVAQVGQQINSRHIPYYFLSLNSTAFIYTVLLHSGLHVPTPPQLVGAVGPLLGIQIPGWDFDLLKPRCKDYPLVGGNPDPLDNPCIYY